MRLLKQNQTKIPAAVLITIATICLVVFGMRIVSLKGNLEKSKPRSLATIEESQKQSCQSFVAHQPSDHAAPSFVTPHGVFYYLVVSVKTILPPSEVKFILSHEIRRIPPRASPVCIA